MVIFTAQTLVIMQLIIYYNEKPIYLTNTLSENLIILSQQSDVVFFNNQKITQLNFVNKIQPNNIAAAIILGNNFTAIKKEFFGLFTNIAAAGGVVINEQKEILFIHRRGKWDLPKGKLEEGENLETCAAREIEEETGISNLTLKRKIGETYHIYIQNDEHILKTSHWYYFTTAGHQKTTAQVEEDITEVKWVKTQAIKEPMANTYSSIKTIMATFFDAP